MLLTGFGFRFALLLFLLHSAIYSSSLTELIRSFPRILYPAAGMTILVLVGVQILLLPLLNSVIALVIPVDGLGTQELVKDLAIGVIRDLRRLWATEAALLISTSVIVHGIGIGIQNILARKKHPSDQFLKTYRIRKQFR